MAQHAQTANSPTARSTPHSRLLTGLWFDRMMALLCGFFVAGLYLDGWAHSHGKVDDTFFTPWHAVMYSAFLAIAALLGFAVVRNRVYTRSWPAALPQGYGLALLGIALFAVGGLGGLVWHELWGIETGVDALMSPSHLLLAVGASLFLAGPLRAAWQRLSADQGWTALLPMLLSLTFLLALWSLIMGFAHPFMQVLAARSNGVGRAGLVQSLGVAGILLHTALPMGLLLLALRRWQLPFGSVMLVLTLATAFISVIEDQYRFVLVAFVAGLHADVLRWYVQPTVGRPQALRIWAFAVPYVLWACYFVTLMLGEGIGWSIHLWLGSVFVAGIAGLLLSYLVVPPAMPTHTQ